MANKRPEEIFSWSSDGKRCKQIERAVNTARYKQHKWREERIARIGAQLNEKYDLIGFPSLLIDWQR
jgi:hypothetical protein